MNKKDTLEALENAKQSHISQMNKIKALLNGESVDNPTAVGKKECDFGKMFYGQRDDLYTLIGAQFYNKIDLLHEQWHLNYVKIYNLFFKEKKKGFFSKLIGANKINPLEYDRGKMYYVELSEVTKELLQLLDASIRRVEALSNSKFKD